MGGYGIGPIAAKGAVFDDFQITGNLAPQDTPALIERDRLHMAARPGFERKLLPIRIDPVDGSVQGGGRYLLETYEDAEAFAEWATNDFELDGVKIYDRPEFTDITASVWHVIGAHDFKDVRERQRLVRVEIWELASAAASERIDDDWTRVRDEAEAADRASIWLLDNAQTNQVATVTVSDQLAPPPPDGPDFASLKMLGEAASPGAAWESGGLVSEKLFDRTSWVFTVWFPTPTEPTWPNSPPLPAPEPVGAIDR